MKQTLNSINKKIGEYQRQQANKFATIEKMNEQIVENLKSIKDENRKTNEKLKSIEKNMEENFKRK